jgi:hypothetical protein
VQPTATSGFLRLGALVKSRPKILTALFYKRGAPRERRRGQEDLAETLADRTRTQYSRIKLVPSERTRKLNDEDRTRRRKEERKRLLERLNSYGEGAPYGPEGEESERELERQREIERSRRPEPGTGA